MHQIAKTEVFVKVRGEMEAVKDEVATLKKRLCFFDIISKMSIILLYY